MGQISIQTQAGDELPRAQSAARDQLPYGRINQYGEPDIGGPSRLLTEQPVKGLTGPTPVLSAI